MMGNVCIVDGEYLRKVGIGGFGHVEFDVVLAHDASLIVNQVGQFEEFREDVIGEQGMVNELLQFRIVSS